MKFKNFVKLAKLETLRIARNKLVLVLLVCFCLVMFIVAMGVDNSKNELKFAIFLNGAELSQVEAIDVVKDKVKEENFIVVNNKDEGFKLLSQNEVIMFFELQETTTENEKIIIHYNQLDFKVQSLVNAFESEKVRFTYEQVTQVLGEDYGIIINKEYFDLVSFNKYPNNSFSTQQLFFSQLLPIIIAVVLMFGLIYLISRDNETKVSKNLAYLPIKKDEYILLKMTPFILLGAIQVIVILLLGWLILGIDFAINPALIFLVSLIFIIATIMYGFLCSLCKSQISASLLAILGILIPFFTYSTSFLCSYYLPVQALICLFPTSFAFDLFGGMVFGGVILWKNVLILAIQSVAYYFIVRFILTRERKNKKHGLK